MAKVLIVEDDEVIASGMAQHLSGAGFDPVTVGRGEVGLARLRYEAPDVLVLDLMLPGLDGWSLIESARAEGIGTPIIVVSARGTEHDRVPRPPDRGRRLPRQAVLDEGARRAGAGGGAERGSRTARGARATQSRSRSCGSTRARCQAYVDGKSAELTPTEFRLLYALALERGRVTTRDELLQKIWGRRETHRDRTVDVFVRRLRDKIDRVAPLHTFIQTRYGVGYKLEPVDKEH
jgi:DNA-binding response OmpR family regulator